MKNLAALLKGLRGSGRRSLPESLSQEPVQTSNREAATEGTSPVGKGVAEPRSSKSQGTAASMPDEVTSGAAGEQAPHPEYAVLLVSGGLSLYLGQLLFTAVGEADRWQAHLFSIIGAVLSFLAVTGFTSGSLPRIVEKPLRQFSRWMKVSPARALLLPLAPWLSFGAALAAGDAPHMKLPLIAVAAWLLAIFFASTGAKAYESEPKAGRWSLGDVVLVGLLFTVAILLRGLWTGKIPWVLTGDEASAGLSALEFVDGAHDNPFSIGWFSFPSMYFFVQSLSIRLFGPTTEALRLPSALIGALTVVGLYAYARDAFGRGVALAASTYLAAFHFHIHFSRIGLNNIWDGLFMVTFSWALWSAWKSGRRSTFVLAGLVIGLAQYFYTSSRALFVMLPLWLVVAAVKDPAVFRRRLPHLVAMGTATLTVILPLGRFFATHPDEFNAPMQRVTILGDWLEKETTIRGEPPSAIIGDQFKKAALGFTHENLRHWYQPGHPMLLPLPAALFILGLILLLLKPLDLRHLWLGLWLIFSVLAVGLSQNPPAAQRFVFAAPVAAVLVALPVAGAASWLSRAWPSYKLLIHFAVGALLILVAAGDLSFYFGDFSANHRFGDLNTETATALGFFLADQEAGLQVYFFGPPRMGYYSLSTVPFLAPKAIGQDVEAPLVSPPPWSLAGPTAFVFLPEREAELNLVRQRYPDGETVQQHGKDDKLLFTAYFVR